MKCPKISDIIKQKQFTVSVEFIPPRNGEDIANVFKSIDSIKDKVDFISVTKGAGGSLRGGTLTVSYFAQERFDVAAIAHFVCRERTKQEIENDLTDLKYFKIRNILALRGDPPAGSSEEWSGDYCYAHLLVRQIKRMNKGVYLPTPTMKKKTRHGEETDFCILVAGHPEEDPRKEAAYMQQKVDAGAEVIITQMIFSFEEYKKYAENLRKAGIATPILAGIRPLVAYKQAESVEKYFNVPVARQLKAGLKKYCRSPRKEREFGIQYTARMVRNLKKNGCPGVHFFVLNDVSLIAEILEICR